jgi:anaerobic selenocysteine-containing dehydrogenase
MAKEIHHVFGHICPIHCARLITVEDGKIVDIARDVESEYPSEWCNYTKCKQIKEVCGHPDRLKYPMRRVGEKGSGKWERISWDTALDTIAETITKIKDKYGAESVAMCLGEPKGMEFAMGQRFASYFGTPNVVTPGFI